jgi:hypothetical protein
VVRHDDTVQDGEERPTSSPLEDLMFHTKSRAEQLHDHADSLACTASSVAEQLRERVVPAVGQAAGNAKEWAKPRVEHGIVVAAPKLESAVSGLAPKVDTARDKIVDELIPRLAEAISAMAAASAAARDEAVSRGQGAAAVISGDAVASPKGRKKRVLLAFGVLTAAAAAAMAVMRKSAPKDDPWTTPIADPYVASSNGRHAAATPVDEATDTAETESEIIEALGEDGTPSPLDPAGDSSTAVSDAAEIDANDEDANGKGVNGKSTQEKGTDETPSE